jgi:hypothetical protein
MRRNGVFWGSFIILLGVVLLLDSLGILRGNFWPIFWSLALIFMGLWFLVGPMLFRGHVPETKTLSIPLEGASSAEVKIRHGAGKLTVKSSPDMSKLAEGCFEGGVVDTVRQEGSRTRLMLQAGEADLFLGIPGPSGFKGWNWDIALNRTIPMELNIKNGASETCLDLSDLKVSDLIFETGASSSDINLPAAAGFTRVTVKSGAASVKIHLPEGVAGRIRTQSGLASVNINNVRFPNNGQVCETPGYETAANRAEIFIETGVGSIEVN